MSSNITIIGNTTRDPELIFLNSGQASAKVSVAVNRRWINKRTNEPEEKVSFFNVVAYGKLAENIATSIPKGSRVVVTGRLEMREWETENKEKRSVIEIIAEDIGASMSFAQVNISRNATNINSGTTEQEYSF